MAKIGRAAKRNGRKAVYTSRRIIDGKYCALWATRHYMIGDNWVYHVSFVVASSHKEAERWYRGKKNLGITGGGLKFLMWAKDVLLELEGIMPSGNRLTIIGADDHRTRAYKYLERYGYAPCEEQDDDGEWVEIEGLHKFVE